MGTMCQLLVALPLCHTSLPASLELAGSACLLPRRRRTHQPWFRFLSPPCLPATLVSHVYAQGNGCPPHKSKKRADLLFRRLADEYIAIVELRPGELDRLRREQQHHHHLVAQGHGRQT